MNPLALKAPQISKEYVPEVGWNELQASLHELWEPGQHLSALGATGGGKTTTLIQLLDGRPHVIALLTKLRDPLFPHLKKRGYLNLKDVSEWPAKDWHPKVALHIPSTGLDRKSADAQAAMISRILHEVWQRGDYDLYIDEIAELTDLLKLDTNLRVLYKEARSSGVSIVAGTQRASRVPLEMYSQPRFLLFWRSSNREELKRLAEMNASDPELVRSIIPQLDRFEILVVDALMGELVRTRPPKL